MRRALLVLALLAAGSAAAQEGHWSGGISTGGWFPIEVDFTSSSLFPLGGAAQKLENVVRDGARVRFEWPEEGDARATFDGTLRGDAIEGTFVQAEARGRFWLTRAARVTSFDQWRGLYANGGRLLWIGRMSEARRQPAFIDVDSGRFGVLYSSSEREWFSGPGGVLPVPVTSRFVFSGDGVTRDATLYRRVDCCVEEEVTWQNGAVTLSGTLVKPRHVSRAPAVVLLHGSGGATRAYFSSLPYLLAHRGIAALVYDKRGSGRSTGNRHTATFYDLADDAIRGGELLAARADIDSAHIGTFGHSQGGWIAPLAAHRWKGFSFAVSSAGPAVSVDDEIRAEKRAALRAAGVSPDDAARALRAVDLYFALRVRRATWAELAAAIAEAKGKPYDRFIFHPASEAEVLKDLEDYDPVPVLRSLRVPLLAMYGGKDPAVTPELNVLPLKGHLAAARNRRSSVRVFPDADHDFIVATADWVQRDRYAAGYLKGIVDWIVTTYSTRPAHTPRRSPPAAY